VWGIPKKKKSAGQGRCGSEKTLEREWRNWESARVVNGYKRDGVSGRKKPSGEKAQKKV